MKERCHENCRFLRAWKKQLLLFYSTERTKLVYLNIFSIARGVIYTVTFRTRQNNVMKIVDFYAHRRNTSILFYRVY